MHIQWYPGHMHKAGKEMKHTLRQIDIIIEMLDARLPFSSENPKLSELRGDKPCIKLLSKTDLADPKITAQWQAYLEQEKDVKTLAISTEQPERAAQIPALCRKMLPHKGSEKTITALIMGIPNVGKSTLINHLAGRMIAKTGNEPAVTKGQQRIDLKNGIILVDTPGMMWPNVENENSGYRLAISGAIKDTALRHDDIAFFAAEYFLNAYPELIKHRFELDTLPKNESELMEIIGRKRGCLQRGAVVDLDKTSKILLLEFRSGILGKMSLETPPMMEVELAELEIIRANKAEKKSARKKKFKKSRR